LSSAKQLISEHVVTGFPDQRLAYISDRIRAAGAHYCAVLKPGTFGLLGLVRFSEVAANPGTATRIFSDLMGPPPPCQVLDSDPVDKVFDLLEKDPAEIAVVKKSGEFVGLITPDGFIRWLLSKTEKPSELPLEKISPTSRWNPHPDPSGGA
jgi:hypothetical protein